MGAFEDCCSNIMEPYGGNMPLFNSDSTTDATVTIVQEAYDDGMKVTRIQTPPRTNTRTLIDAIDNILGIVKDLDIGTMSSKMDKENDNDFSLSTFGKQNDKDKEHDNNGKQKGKSRSGQADKQERVAKEDQSI